MSDEIPNRRPPRKVIQICYDVQKVGEVSTGYLVALCNDGAIFQLVPNRQHGAAAVGAEPIWKRLPPVPSG